MHDKKIFGGIFVLLFMLFITSVYATDIGYVGQNTTLWATIQNYDEFVSMDGANITITDETNTTILYDQPMELSEPGVYYYVFVPNASGIHFVYAFFYNTTDSALATDSFTILSDSADSGDDMKLALVVGLGLFIAFFSMLGIMFIRNKSLKYNELLSLGGIWCLFIAGAFFEILSFILMDFVKLETYSGVVNVIFYTVTILCGVIVGVGALTCTIILIIWAFQALFYKKEEA